VVAVARAVGVALGKAVAVAVAWAVSCDICATTSVGDAAFCVAFTVAASWPANRAQPPTVVATDAKAISFLMPLILSARALPRLALAVWLAGCGFSICPSGIRGYLDVIVRSSLVIYAVILFAWSSSIFDLFRLARSVWFTLQV